MFHHASLQPLTNQTKDPWIADAMLNETKKPFVARRVEEFRNIGVYDPVHLRTGDGNGQRIERVVLPTPRPKPVREPKEVFLPSRGGGYPPRPLTDPDVPN